jgi:hypothetical protein
MNPIFDYRLHLDLPCDRRFGRRVPVVELWVSGKEHVFQRVTAICDSGASRTLLSKPTYERLRFNIDPEVDRLYPMNGLTGQIFYKRQLFHLRIDTVRRPPVHVVVNGGLTDDIEENLIGADLTQYFALMVTYERVMLLGDPAGEE